MSPKILLEKNKERENRRSEEKEKKKVMAALLVFMLTSLEIFLKEKDCLRGEAYFGCKKSSSNIYKFFLPLRLTEL